MTRHRWVERRSFDQRTECAAADPEAPARRCHQPGEHPQERSLSGAVWANQTVDLAAAYPQGHAVDGADPVRVGFGDCICFYRPSIHGIPFTSSCDGWDASHLKGLSGGKHYGLCCCCAGLVGVVHGRYDGDSDQASDQGFKGAVLDQDVGGLGPG